MYHQSGVLNFSISLIVASANIIVLRIGTRVKKYLCLLLKYFIAISIYLDPEIFFDFGDKVAVTSIIDRGPPSIVHNSLILSYLLGILFFLDHMGHHILRVTPGRGMNSMGPKIWRDWKIKKVLNKKEEKTPDGLITGTVYIYLLKEFIQYWSAEFNTA